MARFPTSPNYRGLFAPSRVEADIPDLEVEGEVPAGIEGAFYRVAPDPQLPPRLEDDIWFNGDGMVSMFRFRGGKIDFKQRRARTDKFILEERAGRALFGAYRNGRPVWVQLRSHRLAHARHGVLRDRPAGTAQARSVVRAALLLHDA